MPLLNTDASMNGQSVTLHISEATISAVGIEGPAS